jgi:hypothetical protein
MQIGEPVAIFGHMVFYFLASAYSRHSDTRSENHWN